MIKFTKYGIANIFAMGGVILITLNSPFPIIYSLIGGIFIGKALTLAKQYGQENENSKKL